MSNTYREGWSVGHADGYAEAVRDGPFARTGNWFVAAGQQPAQPTPSPAQVAFYIGMQLEELAEKLEALGFTSIPERMQAAAADLKGGQMDDYVKRWMGKPGVCKALLDADMDLLWVTIGAARAQGADVPGAYGAVTAANWDKFVDGKATLDPVTRKVLKRPGWQAPDLTPFIHRTLRGER